MFAQAGAAGLVVLRGVRAIGCTETTPGAGDQGLEFLGFVVSVVDEAFEFVAAGFDEVVQGLEFGAAGGETGLGDFAELERGIGTPGIDDLLGVDEDFVGRGGSCHDGMYFWIHWPFEFRL